MPSPAALGDVKVLDLTTVVFGPSATQALADYGADVIKVEGPEGDSTRHTGPALEAGMSSLFLGSNRNKRSLVLDLKTDKGRAVLDRLTTWADVLIHNIRPQKLQALGLDPCKACERNPRLIYVGLHGFGEDGPYAGRPAYDDIIQALSGAADLGRRQSGIPRYMPTIMADKVAGQMAVHATLAALYQRERTGRGQYIEVPMFECAVQFLLTEHLAAGHLIPAGVDGQAADESYGYRRTMAAWRRPYATTDGFVCFMPYNDRNWRDFFVASGRDDLLGDPRYANIAARTEHIEQLYALLEAEIAKWSSDHWLELGERLGIPCSVVNRLEDLERDPHLQAVGMFGQLEAGEQWSMRFVRNPVRLKESEVTPVMPPRLGQHGPQVLQELGFDPAFLDEPGDS